MQKKLWFVLALVAVALWVVPASATSTQTLSLPAGSTEAGGNSVSASVKFTFDTDSVMVDLWNTVVNPKTVAQNISDLFFVLDSGQTSGTLSSSSGLERTVASDGTFTPGASVAAGWKLLDGFPYSSYTGLKLDGLNTADFVPAHTIIGLPDGSDVYSNANTSIAGNGPHNPFLFGTAAVPVHFELAISGVTDATRVSFASFSFGTTTGNNVDVNVPLPPSVLLLGSGLLGLGLVRLRRG